MTAAMAHLGLTIQSFFFTSKKNAKAVNVIQDSRSIRVIPLFFKRKQSPWSHDRSTVVISQIQVRFQS